MSKVESYLLGMDCGTTNLKAIILGEDGTVVAEASRPSTFMDLKSDMREQDANEWWNNTVEIFKSLAEQAGYDIVNDLEGVLEKFDQVLGLDLLRAVHLNDSMMPFDSRKDRHAVIGGGEIGLEALLNVMRHPKLKDLPFYLETPLDDAGHKDEIARLKEYLGETRSEHI